MARTYLAAASALLPAALLAACATTSTSTASAPASAPAATARLMTADGKPGGEAVAREVDGGIQVTLNATAMPAGTHGAHVHTVGRCDAPDFASAGGHWNPTGKQHGTANPNGPHAGDFPNVMIAADGSGTLTMMLPAGTMAGLLDADGAAFIIHAAADDNRTDPSGNSGARVACGVFQKG